MTNERLGELSRLLALPWSLRTEQDEDGSWVAHIEELPEFVAAADTSEELEAALWDSLRSLLSSYLAVGDRIPEPARAPDPRQSSFGTYTRAWEGTRNGSATPDFGSKLVDA